MSGLRLSARIYVVAVGASGVALLVWTSLSRPASLDQKTLATALLMLAINTASEHYVIKLPRGGELAASTISQVASIFILPPLLLLLIVAASTILQDSLRRKRWYKTFFNTGQFLLAVGIPAQIVYWYDSTQQLLNPGNAGNGMPRVIAAVAAYYLINTALTNIIIALDQRTPLVTVWLVNSGTSVLLELGMGIIGVLWAYIWLLDPLWSLLAVCPAVMACHAFNHIRRLEDENEQGILRMAETIDARDPYTFQHSRRVAAYVERLATELRLNPNYVAMLTSAARVHDLGKMGIGNEILHKAGGLSKAQWATMRRHPEIGATILGGYRPYRDGVDCVRHHHERYDGTGYPAGLRREDIPLGARIIAVADAYEAMTSDRPYRRALSCETAIEQLKSGMGKQFDPMVAGMFLKVLDQEQHGRNLRRVPGDTRAAEALSAPVPRVDPGSLGEVASQVA